MNGSGVFGTSTNGDGVRALSTNGAAVEAYSNNSYGVSGSTGTTGSGLAGVRGVDESTVQFNSGVYGQSTNGTGVLGQSINNAGVIAMGGASSGNTLFTPALMVLSTSTGHADLIHACEGTSPCDFSRPIFAVAYEGTVFGNYLVANGGISVQTFNTPSGSVDITGQYEKNGLCVAGCIAPSETASGRGVITYTQMVSQPTIEDFGESQLVNGQAFVRLDPKFANVVEQKANYLVFITPEGDANTLYVTDKKLGGFTVRESHGGRSTLMFSYRIVARPFGAREARLPMAELPSLHFHSTNRARLFHSHP